ncbi:uncharacterized protein PG998_006142 [Apiospora kogelbergensis]|uniref:Uncharacterized protein n=1 Tax=Apiospora kogelbergensis TaxID=1337665 RepID=A0AAW0R4C4_9PEZI
MPEEQATREPPERPRSFGIGGAGNIRTRADATLHDLVPVSSPEKKEERPRRRSSVFSSSSFAEGERRRSKLVDNMKGVFRRSSTKELEQEDDN